jgi:hypothetical protein
LREQSPRRESLSFGSLISTVRLVSSNGVIGRGSVGIALRPGRFARLRSLDGGQETVINRGRAFAIRRPWRSNMRRVIM